MDETAESVGEVDGDGKTETKLFAASADGSSAKEGFGFFGMLEPIRAWWPPPPVCGRFTKAWALADTCISSLSTRAFAFLMNLLTHGSALPSANHLLPETHTHRKKRAANG